MSNHYKRGFHVDKLGETLRKSLLEGPLNKFLECVNKNPDLTFAEFKFQMQRNSY